MPASLHVSSCIICDDVRTEIDGKQILIGVYPVGISLPQVPWHAFGSLRLSVIWSGDGQIDFRIRIINPANHEIATANGPASAVWQGFESSITVPGLFFTFDMEGVYDVEILKGGGPWERIHRFPAFIARSSS